MAEEDEKKDRGSDLGETAGRRAGREVGGKIGQGAGSGAPAEAGAAGSGTAGASGGAGGTAAAGAGGSAAAGGTAAAAGTGAAVGGTAGAAGGPAAPITVPLAAAAGAIIGRYWKKILIAVVALVLAIFLFILLPLIVIMMVIFHFAGGGGAGALQPGGGLKPNFCEVGGDPAHCSGELKKILEAAGAAFHTPPVVLAGILSIEGRHVFGYDDPTVLAAAAPGGKDAGGIPRSSGGGVAIAAEIGCAVSYAAAVGPMQFTYAEAAILLGLNPLTYNTWASQASFAQDAINDGRTVNPCNVRDSIYAASHFTKILSQTPPDFTGPWTMEVVFEVGSGYSGVPLDAGGHGCPDPGVPGFNYCQQLWDYVQAYGLGATIDDGTNQIPNGWPLDGVINTIYGEPVYLDGILFEPRHPGFDIGGDVVYASMSGKVTYSNMTPTCGGVIDIINANSGYQLHLVHLAQSTVLNWKVDDFVGAGKYIGNVYFGALPGCSSGTHLHYEVRKDSLLVDPTPLVPDPSTIVPPNPAHTAWQDGDPVRLGGGNWTAHN